METRRPCIIALLIACHVETVRLFVDDELRFKKGEELVMEKKALYCDSTIFDVFTLPMLELKKGIA
jgi:hypothetical protein